MSLLYKFIRMWIVLSAFCVDDIPGFELVYLFLAV